MPSVLGVNVGILRMTRSFKGTPLLWDFSFIGHKAYGTDFYNPEDTQTVTDETGNVTSRKCLTYQTHVTGTGCPTSFRTQKCWYNFPTKTFSNMKLIMHVPNFMLNVKQVVQTRTHQNKDRR
jgi:hypothetical protein